MLPYTVRGAVWLILYLFFILAPLFALLAGTLPPTRDFWTEFSVAIGYSGLAMMGLQFGLTARFRHVTEPWGEDVIYHFHRQISLRAVGLVSAHPIILFVVRPELVALLNSIQAPWRARFAALSTYSLLALVVTALWRAKWNIRYETWHLWHILLAVVAIAAGLAHMVGWSFYLADPWKRALWIGLTIFCLGLAKKVLIADSLSPHVGPVFDAAARGEALTAAAAWGAAYAYTAQLYFDFSGYSDMAVGLGLLFNLRLPINFAAPLRASSIIDLWRRWHISPW